MSQTVNNSRLQALTHLAKQSNPPYCPDLAPNDFFLFPHIKNKLCGHQFLSPEEAVDSFKKHVLKMPQVEWKKCRIWL